MSAQDKTSQVQRVLTTLEVLCGFAERGASNKDLCEASGHAAHHVSRDMAELIAYGWARKSEETGRFYPLPRFTQLSFKVAADFEAAANRLADRKRAMTGGY